MTGKIHSFVYDAADIHAVAAFYVQLAGFKEHYSGDDWVTLVNDSGHKLAFQLAPDHVPPRWPDQAEHPQQFHLDFLTPDMEGDTARAVALGATRLEGGGESWSVLADPSGHPLCICANAESPGIVWQEVSIDCPDGIALGRFYAEVLGYEMTYSGPEGSFITADGQLPVMFQTVAGYHPPRWPGPAHPQQGHFDLRVDDVDAEEARVIGLGATRLPGGGGTTSGFRVFADPAGHPFCLVWGE